MLRQDGTYKWIATDKPSETDRELVMSRNKFRDMFCKIVDNTNLNFEVELWQQTVDIPIPET